MPTRRHLGGAALCVAATATSSVVHAQPPWPGERPIEVVVPFPPAGGVDVMARLFLPFVAQRLPGARFLVSNRAGAAGQIGFEAVFNAAPDGHTLGAATLPNLNAIAMERPVRYRALDFAFLANAVEDPSCLYVAAASPLHSVRDLVEAAKAQPGRLTYGTTGAGSDDHLFMLAFEELAGIPPLAHIPFAGAPPGLAQLTGGHLDIAAFNVGDGLALRREGRLRCLAQAAARRWDAAAEVPTFRELGFDLVMGASRGFVGPPGLPRPVAERLEAAFAAALADTDFLRAAERTGLPLRPLVGAAYREMAAKTEATLRGLWQRRPWRG
ncbi:tripartite tricarboxylate transporter substrate binding protein BugE [Craurococcus roseus]|uniref:Tripartite tricarboxylate transporter substrate binding protein BugE n=1 Tax=Craurococcus roseus TaxID=77585 RepID=A0ABP3PNI4_9PROT